jgi:hypothetical protein
LVIAYWVIIARLYLQSNGQSVLYDLINKWQNSPKLIKNETKLSPGPFSAPFYCYKSRCENRRELGASPITDLWKSSPRANFLQIRLDKS